MGKSRRRYSREFKVEAVKQVVEHGRTVTEVAESLDLNCNMLSSWKTKLEAEGAVASASQSKQTDLEEENRRLRRELAIARQERDILKKATAYFASDKS